MKDKDAQIKTWQEAWREEREARRLADTHAAHLEESGNVTSQVLQSLKTKAGEGEAHEVSVD